MRREPLDPGRPAPFRRHPGDGWAQCAQGHRHWGLHGAAGLLLARRAHDGEIDAVVLQHRALWSDQGGTWGFPGGALAPGESAEVGALREAGEEAGIPAAAVRLRGVVVLEAMKMEQPLLAHRAGRVTGLAAGVGANVGAGTLICDIVG